MVISDLPHIDEGAYGWCLYQPSTPGNPGDLPRLVRYDHDTFWCASPSCKELAECPAYLRQAKRTSVDGHWIDSAAMCFPSTNMGEVHERIAYTALRSFPAHFPSGTRSRTGTVYAISIVPEIDLCRLKIGYTTRPINGRLKDFRTTNPTAILVGLWDADPHDEDLAHASLDGRIGRSEVFNCSDFVRALNAINEVLRTPREP